MLKDFVDIILGHISISFGMMSWNLPGRCKSLAFTGTYKKKSFFFLNHHCTYWWITFFRCKVINRQRADQVLSSNSMSLCTTCIPINTWSILPICSLVTLLALQDDLWLSEERPNRIWVRFLYILIISSIFDAGINSDKLNWHNEAETFSRWHFPIHFLEWRCMNFD